MSDFDRNGFDRAAFDSFCGVIKEMTGLFDELVDFENKKLDAIAENAVTSLDNYLNDEQVYLMKMRGLENKRIKALELMGMPDLTFKEVIEKFQDPEKTELANMYENLSAKTLELKESIAATRRYIDLHLKGITMLLENLEGKGTYSKSGEKDLPEGPQRFVSTKV